MTQQIWLDNPLGKKAGYIEGDTFFTQRLSNMFMIKFQGFGVSQSVLQELKHRGVLFIIFEYKGKTFQRYKTSVDNLLNSQKIFDYEGERLNGQIDRQHFLSLSEMEKI